MCTEPEAQGNDGQKHCGQVRQLVHLQFAVAAACTIVNQKGFGACFQNVEEGTEHKVEDCGWMDHEKGARHDDDTAASFNSRTRN